jgi:pimeloyl-ACP methyl ester carboxylesterase
MCLSICRRPGFSAATLVTGKLIFLQQQLSLQSVEESRGNRSNAARNRLGKLNFSTCREARMDYENYRVSLIKGYYDNQLETLMSDFDPHRKTVILLPGGMGSQLMRSESAFPASPNVISDVVWIDLGIALGDALALEVDAAGRDKDAFVIAAYGPLKFLTENPYGDLKDRAGEKDWNYAVFGYDWRRPLRESAGYFKSWILAFRKRVIDHFGPQFDPIPKLTVVCHSMGGLVATAALADASFSGLGFNAVMTIATPFYGVSTQQERYFKGVSILNRLYDPKDVVRIVASMPGPYTLLFLPKATYDRDRQKLGLVRYPEFDSTDNSIPCDPYDPGMKRRWPKGVRNHWQQVEASRDEMIGIAAPINANIASKFINVRSKLDMTTAVELSWNNVDGDTVNPATSPSPVVGLSGPGDGTVPYWSAFHADCNNRHDLAQARDHANLLRHEEVLTVIEKVVATGKLPTKAEARGRRAAKAIATSQKLDRALDKLAARTPDQPAPAELFEKPVQQALLTELIGGTKPTMAGPSPLAAADAAPLEARTRTRARVAVKPKPKAKGKAKGNAKRKARR